MLNLRTRQSTAASWFKEIILCLTIIVLTFSGAYANTTQSTLDHPFNPDRAKILGYIVSQDLMRYHYSHKRLDDDLSGAAFDLYIKQLDAQKRFLLQTDVKMLGAYENYIDNEIRRGMIHLPIYSCEIMSQRIPIVKKMVLDLLSQPFDMQVDEELETDNKKLDFCATDDQLRERWRKTLKYQVANRYLDLKEDQEKEPTPDSQKHKSAENKKDQPKLTDAELHQQAREKVAKRYTHLFTRMLQDQQEDHFERYLNAISRAYDPHSMYLPPEEKEDFDIHMRGSLEGIGALLREEDGYIKVVNIIPGGAAEQQGELESEDTILKVAQGDEEPVDITDTRIRDAVELIRGPKNTEVRLHIKKADGSRRIIPIVRAVVQIKETFVKSMVVKSADGKENFGYLRIPTFYRDFKNDSPSARNVTKDTKAEIKKLEKQNIQGLIIDLRNNGGGSLTDAVDTTGLFIDQGPIVQIKDSAGHIEVLEDKDNRTEYTGPVVVLINKFSASASEILAGALQDYGRAVIVGSEHTHGKGTVQAVIDIDRDTPLRRMEQFKPLGALKITVQKFYRISGASTQYRGIRADIVLPDRFKAIKSGEKYIDYSLPWDTIDKCDYQPLPTKLPLEQLSKLSSARVKSDEKMQHLLELEQKTKERIDNSKRSLVMADIIAERKELFDGEELDEQQHQEQESDKDEKDWQDKAKVDPYVLEAIAIVKNMNTVSTKIK
ncbi:MAG: carboxy terminal-processing peptidase [Desulfuromonas sp.]|nr:carboxy terminal-processing peptidase [Desulfuromonas sp.]